MIQLEIKELYLCISVSSLINSFTLNYRNMSKDSIATNSTKYVSVTFVHLPPGWIEELYGYIASLVWSSGEENDFKIGLD